MRTIGPLHSGTENSFILQYDALIAGLAEMNYWAGQADLPDGYEEVRIVSIWAEDDERNWNRERNN